MKLLGWRQFSNGTAAGLSLKVTAIIMQKVPWLGKEATRKQLRKGIAQSEANALAEKRANKKKTQEKENVGSLCQTVYSFRVDLLSVARP